MSIAALIQAAEYIERRDRGAEHGYASSLPAHDQGRVGGRRPKTKKSQGSRTTHNELEKNRSESDYKQAKAEAKRKQKRSLFSFSDSEDDERSSIPPPPSTSIAEAGPIKKPRKKTSKSVGQSAPAPSSAPASSSGSCSAGGVLLSSDSEDEREAHRVRDNSNGLVSNLTRRVAGGVLKRSAHRSGDTYVELRVYDAKDVIAAKDWKERLEKANVALRYQANHNAPEFELLKKFLNMVKSNFSEAEGRFFGEKK